MPDSASFDLLDLGAKYALPALLGGASGLLVIFANWGIEKRRMRIQRRQQLVDSWRRDLLPKLEGPQQLGKGTRKYDFMRTPEYASLRPHLNAKLIKDLEGPALRIDFAGEFPRGQLIEEIARIEREWKLV
jgi:hypothetical protein